MIAGYKATKHLLEKWKKKIALITTPKTLKHRYFKKTEVLYEGIDRGIYGKSMRSSSLKSTKNKTLESK